MNRLTRAWKAAVKGFKEKVAQRETFEVEVKADRITGSSPAKYKCGGHHICCPQCGGEQFLMSPPFIFNWAFVLMCNRCGFLQRYGKRPEVRVA